MQHTLKRVTLMIALVLLSTQYVSTDGTSISNDGSMMSTNNSSKLMNASSSPQDVRSNGIMPFVPMRIIDKETGTTEKSNKGKTTTTVKTLTTTVDTGSNVTTVTKLPTTTQKQQTTTQTMAPPTTSDHRTTSTIDPTTTTLTITTTPTSVQPTTSLAITKGITKSHITTTKIDGNNFSSTADTNKIGTSTADMTTIKQTTEVPIKNPSTQKSVSAKSTKQHEKYNATISPTESQPVSDKIHLNVTETSNTTTDPMRILVIYSEDDFISRDSFWPIALALTIGIPTIIVMAVTITVLYRRRMSNPRSRMSVYAGHDYSTM
ncbi:hypothetical protein ACF0H5_013510 [Mactra antiquata]